MTIYIAGPMKGYEYYNFPAFDAARDEIIRRGHTPISPADLDREAGFDPYWDCLPDHDWGTLPPGFDFEACVTRDIAAVRRADTICMLSGWWESTGALAEIALAKWIEKLVFYRVDEIPFATPLEAI